MKKFLFLIILLFPIVVYASDNYKISDYYVSSEIEIAGGMKVKELIVLEGDFDKFTRNIVIKDNSLKDYQEGKINFEKSSIYNCTSVDDIKVAMVEVGQNIDFNDFKNIKTYAKEEKIANGKDNIYTIKETDDGKVVTMYKKSNNKRQAFYLEYVVTNAVVMHEDVAEIYYPYINKNINEKIKHAQVQVFLPDADTTNNFRLWAHGPLKGDVKKILNENKQIVGAQVEVNNLKAGLGLDMRLTFDKTLIAIPQFTRHSKEKALDKIIKVENERMNKAKKNNKQLDFIMYFILIISLIYIIGMIILVIYIFINYDIKVKAKKLKKDKIDIALINYAYNQKITYNTFIFVFLELIYHKNVSMKKNKDVYIFKIVNDKTNEEQKYLIAILKEINNKDEFTLNELKEYINSNDNFSFKYQIWHDKIIDKAKKENLFSDTSFIKKVGILYFILGLIIVTMGLVLSKQFIIYLAIFALMLLFIICIFALKRRTVIGKSYYSAAKEIKKSLKTKNKLEEQDLIYATCLNNSVLKDDKIETKDKKLTMYIDIIKTLSIK